ncbi:hypothetical protein CVIRNUC_007961 [Coccomyxa viridis]|uniref:Uncharacterized protein n=1 Tax=Coccomyxa viridis TaxID=1274662 RepID=A0AAV1ICB1_9CHLO|nr:hypothetical protein CVIRNUC_007961 [Coccomyxa viridis]
MHLPAQPERHDVEEPVLDDKQQAYAHMQATLVSYTLEAGIIFHSIFIGIGYGASNDMNVVRSLTVALCFHQAFEGLALGASFVEAGYSSLKYTLFAAAFVLITPAGVAIGLAVSAASGYNENSKAALASEGAFNAVSAGILSYTAVVDLLHPMFFNRTGFPAMKGWTVPAAMLSAFAGCGAMAVVAIWA